MIVRQVSKYELIEETRTESGLHQEYISIDSEEGQKLIKQHNIKIDLEMKEI